MLPAETCVPDKGYTDEIYFASPRALKPQGKAKGRIMSKNYLFVPFSSPAGWVNS